MTALAPISQVILTIAGVITVLVGGWAAAQLAVVKTLREANEDLRARENDHKEAREELTKQLEAVQNELVMLRRMVTGEDRWKDVDAKLSEIHGILEYAAAMCKATR